MHGMKPHINDVNRHTNKWSL